MAVAWRVCMEKKAHGSARTSRAVGSFSLLVQAIFPGSRTFALPCRVPLEMAFELADAVTDAPADLFQSGVEVLGAVDVLADALQFQRLYQGLRSLAPVEAALDL